VSIEAVLFERLKAGVPLVNNRVYGATAPQSVAKPYIVYHKLSPGREYSHDGFGGLARPRIQVSCYGQNYDNVKDVAEEVIATLEAWPGVDSVDAAFIESEIDLYESDTGLYHCAVDVFLWNRN